jgi:hypothetical protein
MFFSGTNGLKRVARKWKMMERSGRQRPHRTDENVENVRNLVHAGSQPILSCGNTEAVT